MVSPLCELFQYIPCCCMNDTGVAVRSLALHQCACSTVWMFSPAELSTHTQLLFHKTSTFGPIYMKPALSNSIPLLACSEYVVYSTNFRERPLSCQVRCHGSGLQSLPTVNGDPRIYYLFSPGYGQQE